MQSHKDLLFHTADEEQHIYFRGYHEPDPVLDFLPWPIRVTGVWFQDGSLMTSAQGGASLTPWQSNINANGYSLNNANNVFANYGDFDNSSLGVASADSLTVQNDLVVNGNIDASSFTINGTPFTGGFPAGASTQIQFNSSGDFGASQHLSYVQSAGQTVYIGNPSNPPATFSELRLYGGGFSGGISNSIYGIHITGQNAAEISLRASNGFVGIGKGDANYMLDIAGNCNVTVLGSYSINGVGFAVWNASSASVNLLGAANVTGTAPATSLPNGTLWFDTNSLSLNVLYNGSWVQV